MKTQLLSNKISGIILGTIVLILIATTGFGQHKNNENRNSGKNDKRNETEYSKQQVEEKHHRHQSNRYRYNEPRRYEKHNKNKNNQHVNSRQAAVQYRIKPYPYRNINQHGRHCVYYRNMPHQTVPVILDGKIFYYLNNQFFVETHNGFQLVLPPRYVHRLPVGCKKVLVYGKPMYTYHGLFFAATHFGYEIYV